MMSINVSELLRSLALLSIVMARLVACFNILPFMGGRLLPRYVKNAIMLSLAIIIYPMVMPSAPARLSVGIAITLLVKEIFVGITMGFVVGIVFWAVEIAGFLVDNQRGASMAAVFDPLYGHNTSPTGLLLLQLVTVLMFATGGFLVFLDGVFESYRFWPVFSFFPTLQPKGAAFFLAKMDQLMRMGLLLGAPFMAAIFLVDISLGLVNRFVPQLNVFFLSMPVKSGVATFMLILYLAVLVNYYGRIWPDLDKVIEVLRGCFR